jgi:osmotically-inducible protein OsmY
MAAASQATVMVLPSRDPGDGTMNLLIPPSADRETSTGACPSSIGRRAEEQLRRSGYLALRDVSCDARRGVVYLRGSLPSYYLKQVAQAIAAGVEGVGHVINRIQVLKPAGRAPVGHDRGERSANPSD